MSLIQYQQAISKLQQLEQIPWIFAGQALNPLQPVLQGIAVDVQRLRGLGDTAVMVNEAAQRLQQIGGILQLDYCAGTCGEIGVAQLITFSSA
ncbi:hypothetical protein M2105_003099 [Paenibacillus sp. PastF-1]|nr:hypothetical protein [Paenibacillus sp. PastF-2]MDF9848673.1 hypothetical protein [Paenibacillus sp. PastM-2]MDF9855242.1 hypothetical protein [Paenibacillus sp. PastF-1]MDH6480513.1 hypothetical protein [Paenibacillus sp. PastH-2]MDH6507940.1 hypothetical protein [Paenibacillus sp. PastM-3]